MLEFTGQPLRGNDLRRMAAYRLSIVRPFAGCFAKWVLSNFRQANEWGGGQSLQERKSAHLPRDLPI